MSNTRAKGIIRENFHLALDVIRAHKLRSGLIILGVSIGVAALMGMVSILLGLGDKITRDFHSSESTVVGVVRMDFLVGGFDEAKLHRRKLTEEDARAVRENCPSLQHVSYHVDPHRFYTVRSGNEKSRMIQVVGTQPSLLSIWNLEMENGRMFTDEEVLHRAKVIVLGYSPRRDLFPNFDPIGKRVKIENDEYVVVGTFVERKTLFGSMGENFAILPYTTFLSNLWQEHDERSIFAALREGVPLEVGKDELTSAMRIRRGLRANQDNDFDIFSSDAMLELLGRITAPIALILATISSIGLLVGGIGVMNMMLVSVTERTSEIGIRKAVGATRRDILWQFLIEAGTLTGIGGVLGVLLGLTGALTVSALTGLPVRLSPFYVSLAVLFSVGIGVFFGMYPANRASKLEPVQAIGYAK